MGESLCWWTMRELDTLLDTAFQAGSANLEKLLLLITHVREDIDSLLRPRELERSQYTHDREIEVAAHVRRAGQARRSNRRLFPWWLHRRQWRLWDGWTSAQRYLFPLAKPWSPSPQSWVRKLSNLCVKGGISNVLTENRHTPLTKLRILCPLWPRRPHLRQTGRLIGVKQSFHD